MHAGFRQLEGWRAEKFEASHGSVPAQGVTGGPAT